VLSHGATFSKAGQRLPGKGEEFIDYSETMIQAARDDANGRELERLTQRAAGLYARGIG